MIKFIDDHRGRFGVEPICPVLTEHGVPIAPSGYYAARSRPLSTRAVRDELVVTEIRRVFHDRELGRGLYGARKVWHQLRREGGVDGQAVPRCQVERLMRADGLRGAVRGRPTVTTRPDRAAARPPDLVDRGFTAQRPNQLWVGDFAYVPTWSGTVFTAFVSDVFSRRIVGWRTTATMPTELPLDAPEMALWTRDRAGHDTTGLVHHSDAGSLVSTPRSGMRTGYSMPARWASIGTVGDCYDNALAESVIGLYKTEFVRHDGPWCGLDDLELATLSWVHWLNNHRLHSMIGNVPLVEHETDYYRHNQLVQQPLPGELSLH